MVNYRPDGDKVLKVTMRQKVSMRFVCNLLLMFSSFVFTLHKKNWECIGSDNNDLSYIVLYGNVF